MPYTFTNLVSSSPINSNVGYNNSWIDVDNNADRPLCAQAMYITNLDEMVISLSTADVDIGHVKLQDADSELKANVVTVSPGVGGLVVSVANPVTTVNATISNPVTAVTVSNPTTNVSTNLATSWDVLSAAIAQNVFTTLPSNAANTITIVNDTGYTLYIKNASKTLAIPLLDKNALELALVGNTNEVAIKQTNSATAPIVYGVFIKY